MRQWIQNRWRDNVTTTLSIRRGFRSISAIRPFRRGEGREGGAVWLNAGSEGGVDETTQLLRLDIDDAMEGRNGVGRGKEYQVWCVVKSVHNRRANSLSWHLPPSVRWAEEVEGWMDDALGENDPLSLSLSLSLSAMSQLMTR